MFPLLVFVKINQAEIKLEAHVGTKEQQHLPSTLSSAAFLFQKRPLCTLQRQVMDNLVRVYMQVLFQRELPPSPDCISRLSRQRMPLRQPCDGAAPTERALNKQPCHLTQDSRL